ncbi:hypothetical protein CERZMDRAFT_103094 [Cercospora zeae-maydis SCOH1-5]|uniref:Uncharacterized protein n=1 Tax=Cercospora zeae-maydis SCOH1-5 TaxID=717836 RepID=A0A6A6EWR8_9PEZI|nr:hypothetical protein CERZMDRAFT_103094 [Cercospora zeae-maydis SCOH1-5]
MDTQETSTELPVRRIILRFRTADAPNDSEIIQAFYNFTGLNDELCFVHWQTRETKHTFVVLDVHNSKHFSETTAQNLPHEVYQMTWEPEGQNIKFTPLDQIAGKLAAQYTKKL